MCESGEWTDNINPYIVFYRINDVARAMPSQRLKMLTGTPIKVIKKHKDHFAIYSDSNFVRRFHTCWIDADDHRKC